MPIKRRELLLGSVAAFGCRLFANRIPVRAFTSLFDGATLDGWFKPDLSASNQLYTGGRWEVRDGCICAEQYPAGDSRGSVLLTERTAAILACKSIQAIAGPKTASSNSATFRSSNWRESPWPRIPATPCGAHRRHDLNAPPEIAETTGTAIS